ncbi:MAG: hypothetical protein NZ455_06655 [Bacteroidia bacterium]|nr:hypothetical protein [Bacteroidia bacterium]MDW8345716.1 hypothetical protein [Bacteroidia bacterium]
MNFTFFIFGRVPRCARVGLLRTARSLRCYATASHCLTACSVSLTQAASKQIPLIQKVIL